MPNTASKKSIVEFYISHIMEINCRNVLEGLKFSVISYQVNQLVDLQLWDSDFCPISLFEINKYLENNVKNIIYSFLRMAVFIKQYSLENKTSKDISWISEFGFAAWKFFSFIYESSWNKLIANEENKTFRQHISLQFNKTYTNNMTSNKLLKEKSILDIRLKVQ